MYIPKSKYKQKYTNGGEYTTSNYPTAKKKLNIKTQFQLKYDLHKRII